MLALPGQRSHIQTKWERHGGIIRMGTCGFSSKVTYMLKKKKKACGTRWDFNMSLGQNRLQHSNNPHCTIGVTVITLRSCWVSIMRKSFVKWTKAHVHKCSECHPFYVWGFPLCVWGCGLVKVTSCQEFKDPSALPLRAVQPTLGLRTRYRATE